MKYSYGILAITILSSYIITNVSPPSPEQEIKEQRFRFCNAPKDKPHVSSYPYISGDTFRAYADFVVEDENDYFEVDSVQPGNIIFVQTNYLKHFFDDIHPFIEKPYILITHNDDDPAPGPYLDYLQDDRIIAWFGQNPSITHHDKFVPIPIGIANQSFSYGDISILDKTINLSLYTKRRSYDHLVYMNFSITTNVLERKKAYYAFIDKEYCTPAPRLNYERYIKDLSAFHFVVSPEGNGLDCYRTWEAMLLGCIPIVKHSTLDPLFDGLPVLLINDWDEATEEFLIKNAFDMRKKMYRYEKLYMDYWLRLIKKYQKLYT